MKIIMLKNTRGGQSVVVFAEYGYCENFSFNLSIGAKSCSN